MIRAGRAHHRSSWVRVRVTTAATAVSLVGALVASALFVAGLRESLEQALLTSAQQQAESVIAQLEDGTSPGQAAVTGKQDIVVQVIDRSGVVIGTDHEALTEPILTGPGASEGIDVPHLQDDFAVYAKRSRTGELVLVGVSEEQVVRAAHTAIFLLAIAVPLGLVLIALVVWLSIGRALLPVEVMRREAAAITTERLHHRLAVPPGDDEIPLLASTLNEMLDRIDQTHQQQRQFVSDASHELRSPLAVVRQMVEVARRHPENTTVERLANEVWHEEVRMEGLVKSLLTLARLDDQEPTRVQLIDLDDKVLQEAERVRIGAAGVNVDLHHVSAGQIQGDPVLFTQVVANLLSNAARHARSLVRISLDEVGDRVLLVVEDDGHGVPEADRERIFERFARLDEARARDSGGAGLGLAIVEKVVTGAHGTVRVEDSDLGGARFVVDLPTRREQA